MKRFTLGSSSIGDLEKKYVMQVLDNNYISPGPVTKEVEDMCAKLHGLKHGLAIHSGQSAIHVAIQAICEMFLEKGIHKENEKPLVAVPACTYISTLAAAVLAGCDIVMVDVDLSDGNMSPSHLREVLNRQIAVNDPVDIIIPVHLYGKACSSEIFDIAEQYGIWTIEDACESTFAPNIGRGHVLTTSFFSNHLISAGGGGVIMTNHDDIDEYCWKLINHGRSSRFGNEDIHKIAEKFHFDKWGHSMKWNDVSAAIAKAQIERKDELFGARQHNAQVLWGYLWGWQADYKKIILPDMEGHTFMMYPIVLQDPAMNAQNIIQDLNDAGIEVRRMMPITNQPVVQEYFGGDLEAEFPNAHLINQQGFYVGVHPELSRQDAAEMGEIIHNVLKKECLRLDPNFVAPHEVRDAK